MNLKLERINHIVACTDCVTLPCWQTQPGLYVEGAVSKSESTPTVRVQYRYVREPRYEKQHRALQRLPHQLLGVPS